MRITCPPQDTATYAVNGLNFSFGRDGIVASVDALYWRQRHVNGRRVSALLVLLATGL